MFLYKVRQFGSIWCHMLEPPLDDLLHRAVHKQELLINLLWKRFFHARNGVVMYLLPITYTAKKAVSFPEVWCKFLTIVIATVDQRKEISTTKMGEPMIKSKLLVFFSMVSTGCSVNQIVTCLDLCSHFGAFGNSHFNFNPKKLGSNTLKCYGCVPNWGFGGEKSEGKLQPLETHWWHGQTRGLFFDLKLEKKIAWPKVALNSSMFFLNQIFFQKIMIKMNEDSVFLVVNDYKLYNIPTFKEIIPFMVVSSVGVSVHIWKKYLTQECVHPRNLTCSLKRDHFKKDNQSSKAPLLVSMFMKKVFHWKCGNVNMWFVTQFFWTNNFTPNVRLFIHM